MRAAGLIPMLPLLVSCGPKAAFDATCNEIFTVVCSHQLECNQVTEHATCDAEMRDHWICNPEVSIDELKVCKDLAPSAGCAQAMPEECYDVLCDKEIGCITTSIDTSDPEGTHR